MLSFCNAIGLCYLCKLIGYMGGKAVYCLQRYKKMMKSILIGVLIIAIAVALLAVKVIFRRNGSFASPHIHDSEYLKSKGIHCVLDQDREMRAPKKGVSERSKS